MPLYPMLNKANDPEYWLLIGRESGQVSHEYWWEHISYAYLSNVKKKKKKNQIYIFLKLT